MSRLFKQLFILPIRFYQIAISPLLGSNCRFTPTCSNYMLQAIEEWGVFKGIWLGAKRIGKCHPWGSHGHDPVPKKSDRK
ncbi:MAG: membrane protein insertion efficiency factor YidD [Bacteroidota bacterium]